MSLQLHLVVVKELLDDDTIDDDVKMNNDIGTIECTWIKELFNKKQLYLFTTNMKKNYCHKNVFATSKSLINFGKYLIDYVLPQELINSNYEYEHLIKIADELDNIDYLISMYNIKYQLCEEMHPDNVNGVNNIKEFLEVLDKYYKEANDYIKMFKNPEIAKYMVYSRVDIKDIPKMVKFGLQLIDYGNKGYKAYWVNNMEKLK